MAERAARAGGVVARQSFRQPQVVETKANKNDLVTESDRDAQRQVIATIQQEFPDSTFVCEEESTPPAADVTLADSIPDDGLAWVVDPIDGTGNYVRGMQFWSTSVVAVEGGDPAGAGTFLPALGDCYTAGPESVMRNDEPMAVSDRGDPETFAIGLLGWWPSKSSDGAIGLYREINRRFGDVRRLGSMQGELALVAAGTLDGAIMPTTPHPWDAVAGVHLVRRAGGTATDVHGEPWRPDAAGLVVSNGERHDVLLETVSSVDRTGAVDPFDGGDA